LNLKVFAAFLNLSKLKYFLAAPTSGQNIRKTHFFRPFQTPKKGTFYFLTITKLKNGQMSDL